MWRTAHGATVDDFENVRLACLCPVVLVVNIVLGADAFTRVA